MRLDGQVLGQGHALFEHGPLVTLLVLPMTIDDPLFTLQDHFQRAQLCPLFGADTHAESDFFPSANLRSTHLNGGLPQLPPAQTTPKPSERYEEAAPEKEDDRQLPRYSEFPPMRSTVKDPDEQENRSDGNPGPYPTPLYSFKSALLLGHGSQARLLRFRSPLQEDRNALHDVGPEEGPVQTGFKGPEDL